MFKRILTFAGLLLSLLLVVSASWAAEVSLLNANFERLKGKSIPYEVPFYAEEGMGTLILSNGANDGNYRISSATITLNGEVIVTPNDMNQDVSELTQDVYLMPENVLVVELTSAPESFIDISVRQEVFADAEKVIDSSGGVLEVTDQGSPLYGTSLEIQSGALSEPTTITVTALDTPPETQTGIALTGQPVDLEPEGLLFNEPIKLTLNYSDSNNDGIVDGTITDEIFVSAGYFNELTGIWEPIEIIGRDFVKNTITIEINHFSLYSPFYSIDDNKVSMVTNQVSDGQIKVNGYVDLGEWAGLTPTPIKPDYNGEEDSVCGPGTDIKSVYTAMDSENAYFMIQTIGPIADDIAVTLEIDTKEGKNLVSSIYGEYGLGFGGSEGIPPNRTACWNDSGPVFSYVPPEIEGWEHDPGLTRRGDVIEAQIPLTSFADSIDDIKYINITSVKAHYDNYAKPCDVDRIYPSLDFFRLQYRYYMEDANKDHVRLVFNQLSRDGVSPESVNFINNATITKIGDNGFVPLEFTANDFIGSPLIEGWGVYSELANYDQSGDVGNLDKYGEFYYSDFKEVLYFTKKWSLSDYSIADGDYKMSLTATDDNTYEALYKFTDPGDIPSIDASTISCDIDENGGLNCSFGIEQFVDVDQSKFSLMAELKSFPLDDSPVIFFPISLRYLKWTEGHLKDEFYVPSEILDVLTQGAKKVTLTIRSRPIDDSVRKYSIPVILNGILGLPPSE